MPVEVIGGGRYLKADKSANLRANSLTQSNRVVEWTTKPCTEPLCLWAWDNLSASAMAAECERAFSSAKKLTSRSETR